MHEPAGTAESIVTSVGASTKTVIGVCRHIA